ncbi:MAG: phosphoenolpyruvate synthase [Chlamydiae bacterium]|nr:phosphoenolpyruvate synthase [Chlamydiota bacterium]
MMSKYIKWFEDIRNKDIAIVGGKNASIGEMFSALKQDGINVPDGFAITAEAYFEFLEFNHLKEKILTLLKHKTSLSQTGKKIRALILKGKIPPHIAEEILAAYHELGKYYKQENVDVAIRSSATAEDLPYASFAGQLESFLNIRNDKNVMEKCLECYSSLFTDRAIIYREEKNFDSAKIGLSIGVQKMVRSDLAGSGVMFTLDTESGFRNVINISAGFGLGENIVQGTINPDEYIVFKPLLDDEKFKPIIEKKLGRKVKKLIYKKNSTKNILTTKKEKGSFVLNEQEILTLAKWGKIIEDHYQKPMDIEWAKDGKSNKLFIVQARPETVESQKKTNILHAFVLKEKGKVLTKGVAIGQAITKGKAQIIKNVKDIEKFQSGNILVTQVTSPDWVPIMKKAKGIITDHGGRTSHAAIVSRELNLPAIVGTIEGTLKIKDGQMITLSCAEGSEGFIYEGLLNYDETEIDILSLKKPKTQIMINLASPDEAFRWCNLPCQGVGLARMEFIITNIIKIHPMALVHLNQVKNLKTRRLIKLLTKGYLDKKEYFIDLLSQGIAKIAASQYPSPVIVRMSDFKTNEYANLIGGKDFEFTEENPMIGFRGASRYYSKRYKEGFELECKAIKRAREVIGLKNIIIMIPFCRTLEEADKVLEVLKEFGLKKDKELKVYCMAEIPSNVILAKEFADRFDGFSIGSNDLTQLTLGVDRDSEELSKLFDERNPAVLKMIAELIEQAHEKNCKVGICGQAPSDYVEFAEFLVNHNIDSISLNPDSVIKVISHICRFEKTE